MSVTTARTTRTRADKPSTTGRRKAAPVKAAPAKPEDKGPHDLLRRSTVDAYTEVFRALSEPTRIEILSLIAGADDEYPCTRLEKVLPVTKSTISYHIKILSNAGLVQVRKAGKFYHYRVRADVLDYFLPGFMEHLTARED